MTETCLDDKVQGGVGRRTPGVTLVVVGTEGVRACSSVGLADLIADEPMTIATAVPWFSMTKVATATTLMRLAEGGALELDQPVFPLVSAMRLLRPTAWAQRITARHLLQH